MKRIIKLFVLLIVMFITPNVFAANKVSIESVTLEDKSDTVTEVNKPSVKDLNISFDLSFSNVRDYAKYKVVINNTTNTDYEISKDNNFNKSDYLEYKYEFDNTNVVKANSKLTMYVVITYKNEVPSNKLVDGKYVENNNMAISLSNGEEVSNPKTGLGISLIIGLILVIGITLIVVNNNKSKNYLSLLVVGLMMIPLCGYALEKLQINVNTKVTIEEKYEVTYSYWTYLKDDELSDYLKVMTPEQYKLQNGGEYYTYYYYVDGVKYTNYFVTKIDNRYSKGETVSVKNPLVYRRIECNVAFTGNRTDGYTCSDGVLSEKQYVINSRWVVWGYNSKIENDIQNMKFSDIDESTIYSYEDNNGDTIYSFSLQPPKQFIMPSHSVDFFEIDIAD